MNSDTILFGLTTFTLMLTVSIPFAGYAPVDVPGCSANPCNPWCDLIGGIAGSSSMCMPFNGGAGGTVNQAQSENVRRTSAATGACIGVGAIGVGVGGLLGLVFAPGLLLLPLVGGLAGCVSGYAAGSSNPTQTQALYNDIVQKTGPLGQFLQAFTAAAQYVAPLIQFEIDWVPYTFALAKYEPAAAILLAPFLILTTAWWAYAIVKIVRGVGALG